MWLSSLAPVFVCGRQFVPSFRFWTGTCVWVCDICQEAPPPWSTLVSRKRVCPNTACRVPTLTDPWDSPRAGTSGKKMADNRFLTLSVFSPTREMACCVSSTAPVSAPLNQQRGEATSPQLHSEVQAPISWFTRPHSSTSPDYATSPQWLVGKRNNK